MSMFLDAFYQFHFYDFRLLCFIVNVKHLMYTTSFIRMSHNRIKLRASVCMIEDRKSKMQREKNWVQNKWCENRFHSKGSLVLPMHVYKWMFDKQYTLHYNAGSCLCVSIFCFCIPMPWPKIETDIRKKCARKGMKSEYLSFFIVDQTYINFLFERSKYNTPVPIVLYSLLIGLPFQAQIRQSEYCHVSNTNAWHVFLSLSLML